MKSYEKFILVPAATDLAGISDWSVRADNVATPGGRMLLLRVGSPDAAAALLAVKGAVELGTNLDASVAKVSAELSTALSLSSGATVREKIAGRFGPEYDPFN